MKNTVRILILLAVVMSFIDQTVLANAESRLCHSATEAAPSRS